MNQQQAEKRVTSDLLDVHSIFPTIQGEGPFAGNPATFVRLAGCNLQCPLCDTAYTEGRKMRSPAQVMAQVEEVSAPRKLLVISGGEPFRQDLTALVRLAKGLGYTVQIETNGTLAPSDAFPLHKVTVVCSPKAGKVAAQLVHRIDAWKYVLHTDSVARDGLPLRALDHPAAPHVARPPDTVPRTKIYVQPVDVGDPAENQRHLKAAMASCLKHGYTLGLQLHKIIGVE